MGGRLRRIIRIKAGSLRAPAGARLVMEAPGSGGYGPPSVRDPALVREDRADGYVTRDAARREYQIASSERAL